MVFDENSSHGTCRTQPVVNTLSVRSESDLIGLGKSSSGHEASWRGHGKVQNHIHLPKTTHRSVSQHRNPNEFETNYEHRKKYPLGALPGIKRDYRRLEGDHKEVRSLNGL